MVLYVGNDGVVVGACAVGGVGAVDVAANNCGPSRLVLHLLQLLLKQAIPLL